jgi:hypothetical protein
VIFVLPFFVTFVLKNINTKDTKNSQRTRRRHEPPRKPDLKPEDAEERAYEPLPKATEETGRSVFDSALAVHRALGPGLLESAYEVL